MGKMVLVVEDEPQNRRLFSDMLRKFGYSVIEAADGKQGIELARAKRPDLILMDTKMPVMGGTEATKILKKDATTWGIPIVALTAYVMEGDEETALEAGCDGYITKPIDIQDFLKKVAECLKIEEKPA